MELMSKWSSKVRIEELIDNVLNRMGKFQRALILLLCINSVIIGINHTITSFHILTPDYYYCQDNNKRNCPDETPTNETCPTDGFVFMEPEITSIVTEWSLVCSRRLLAPLVNTLYFGGVTIGALACGTLSDLFGRMRLVIICLYGQAVLGISLYFADSLQMFMSLRTIQGFFVQGLQGCTYTLLLEFCAPKYRTATAVMWELFWALGLAVLASVAYFVRNWRTLQLVLSIPSILTLLYIWLIPESPRWLLASGKQDKALKAISTIAKKNKDQHLLTEGKIAGENDDEHVKINADGDMEQKIEETPEKKINLLDIFVNRILRKHLFIMVTVWFCVTLSYYGTVFLLPNMPGNRYVNFFIGAVIEAFAYVIAYFILSRIGRRQPMMFYQIVNGVLCLVIGLIFYLTKNPEDANENVEFLKILLIQLAKGLAVSSFCGMFIYTSELFPTTCRGAALGLCGFWARIGSLTAPQLMILVEYTGAFVPMAIMGGAVILSGCITFYLPETLNKALPNTMNDVNQVWGTKQKINNRISN